MAINRFSVKADRSFSPSIPSCLSRPFSFLRSVATFARCYLSALLFCVSGRDKRHDIYVYVTVPIRQTHTHARTRTFTIRLHILCMQYIHNILCARELMKRISMAFLVQIHHENVNTLRQRHNGISPTTIRPMKMKHTDIVSICII